MKYFYYTILLLALVTSCRQKLISGKELEDKLIETMKEHLDETLPAGTEFTIKDLTYYPDQIKRHYNCEFGVIMRAGNKDTSGVMKAIISDDFKKVARTQ